MTSLYSSTFYGAHNIEISINMFYLILCGMLTVYNRVTFSKEREYCVKFKNKSMEEFSMGKCLPWAEPRLSL